MEFFDVHAYINFNAFKNDGDEVIRRSLDAGMRLILPGSQIDTSRRAVEYAERWSNNLPTSDLIYRHPTSVTFKTGIRYEIYHAGYRKSGEFGRVESRYS